jgi:hypothetical protein
MAPRPDRTDKVLAGIPRKMNESPVAIRVQQITRRIIPVPIRKISFIVF